MLGAVLCPNGNALAEEINHNNLPVVRPASNFGKTTPKNKVTPEELLAKASNDKNLSEKRLKLKKAAESMKGWQYSQSKRMTDGFRDCSSFVHTSLMKAGLMPKENWGFTTYTMPNYTKYLEQIPFNELKVGDIVLGDGHVAFYWGKDNQGFPKTLESAWNFGVTEGYMMSNGWHFQYTSAWRVKGIDNPLKTV